MISILSPGFSKQPVTATLVGAVLLSSPRKLQGLQLGPGNAGSRIISSINPLAKITLIFGIPVLLHPPLEYPTTSIQGGSKKKRAFFNSYKIIKMKLIIDKVSYVYDSNTVIYLPAGSIPFAVSAATLALGISSIGFSSTGSFGMESERDVKVKGYEIGNEISSSYNQNNL